MSADPVHLDRSTSGYAAGVVSLSEWVQPNRVRAYLS